MTTIHDPRLLPFSFSRNFGLLAQAGVGGDGTDVWVSSATKSSAIAEVGRRFGRLRLHTMAREQLEAAIAKAYAGSGGPSRALRLNAEIMPGIVVKAINSRSVIVTGKGAEREIALPAFASQGGIVPDAAGLAGQNNANAYRPPLPTRAVVSSPAPIPVASVAGTAGASNAETGASGAGNTVQGYTGANQPMNSIPLQEPQVVAPSNAYRR